MLSLTAFTHGAYSKRFQEGLASLNMDGSTESVQGALKGAKASATGGHGEAIPPQRRHFEHRREELKHQQAESSMSGKEPAAPSQTLSSSTPMPSSSISRPTAVQVDRGEIETVRPDASEWSALNPVSSSEKRLETFEAPSPAPPSSHSSYFFCDVCHHSPFATMEEVESHIVQEHSDHLPDYLRLRNVVRELSNREVWQAAKQRTGEKGLFESCGRRVLEEGRLKDPGPERMEVAHRAREQLEAVVRQWHPTAKVYIFGSSVTFGIWDGMGDIDFTVVDEAQLAAGTWPPPERNAVRSITELLRRAGFSYVNLEPISHARVPIIKHHASHPLRMEPSAVRKLILAESSSVDEKGENPSSSGTSEERGNEVALQQSFQSALDRRLEAEDIIARSVRYVLNAPATWEDRILLEASIREAVGPSALQQIWWNRSREVLHLTLDSTTNAIRAATSPLAVSTPTLRARIQPLHEDCRPELYNIDFDLSFRVFGIRNSQLLRRYFMQHPCARPGAMILKEWSKRCGVNNSVNGFLTSYAVAILWLYFLLQKKVVQFVDPVKDIPASLEGCPQNPLYVPMVDPSWTEKEYEQHARQAGDLLVEFFYFYAIEFDWENYVVSLNRQGVTTKRELGWIEEGDFQSLSGISDGPGGQLRRHHVRYNFCIEDPYEENLNLGRHMGLTKTLRVQSEFFRGLLSLLKNGAQDSCVFPPPVGVSGTPELSSSLSQTVNELVPPHSLAHQVLYRLMAVSLREVAKSKLSFHQQTKERPELGPISSDESGSDEKVLERTPTASAAPLGDGDAKTTWPGLSQAALRSVFEAKAPGELKIALKVWNWQQLLHRLGYKLHRDSVFLRREVGGPSSADRASTEPPPGVQPTSHAKKVMKLQDSSGESSLEHELLPTADGAMVRPAPAKGLLEEMQVHTAEGFLQLTPEWVGWSEAWAGTTISSTSSRTGTGGLQSTKKSLCCAPSLSCYGIPKTFSAKGWKHVDRFVHPRYNCSGKDLSASRQGCCHAKVCPLLQTTLKSRATTVGSELLVKGRHFYRICVFHR